MSIPKPTTNGQLSSPHQAGVFALPSVDSACNYLEHTNVEDLKMRSDTGVLHEAFFAKGDSLDWHKEALASPMGTDIPNPKNLKR